MTCQICKGIGSVVRANTSTGEFEIRDCSCKKADLLLNHWFIESNNNRVYEVAHVEDGLLITLEYYTTGEKYKRIINQWLFEEGISTGELLPFNKPSYQCQSCQKTTIDYLINHKFQCQSCHSPPDGKNVSDSLITRGAVDSILCPND